MFDLTSIHACQYVLPKTDGMRVPGLIIATPEQIQDPELFKPLQQVQNVAYLPGIQGYSIAMPDIHWGYGFPIGGVAATDAEHGVISPGGVGYDINCGVRLALVPLPFKQLSEKQKKDLLKSIFKHVPSGVGKGHKTKSLSDADYAALTVQGAKWSIEQGFGLQRDLDYCESHGVLKGADIKAVSEQAKSRGKDQLGSIGSGNHFVEIGEVQEIFLAETARLWGVDLGATYILIHCGSRGFGHQVCQDTLNRFVKKGYAEGLPDRQLVAAPIKSADGQQYFAAMAAAANYAFNNRQQILHAVRLGFKEVLGVAQEDVKLLYDVCHNIAKFEEYEIEGKIKRLCVHRKGATRAFGAGAKELNPVFKQTGQPVLVPGDMGRASYIMVGQGNTRTFCSACHGAGRAKSRVQSANFWKGKDPVSHMKQQGILVMANSMHTISEEMPDAYKDVDIVVQAVEEANLASKLARLKPHLVIKG